MCTENSGYNQYRKAERLKDLMCINSKCLTDIILLASRTLIWNNPVNTQVNVFMNYSLENVTHKPISLPDITMIFFFGI